MSDDSRDSRREQAQALIIQHMLRRRQGSSVSDADLIAAHAHLREELSDGLKKAHVLSLAFAEAGADSERLSLPTGASERSVGCPACHAPLAIDDTDVVVGTTIESVCGSCGRQVVIRQEPNVDRVAHFELIERLGSGGFGTVWRALDTKLDREVALKIARRQPETSVGDEAFVREAKAAATLRHPHIVATYEVGRDGATAYIATALVEGTSLKERLDRLPFTASEAAKLCRTVANAVHYAHEEGVIHRDLKPQNILLDIDDQPHIADFGLARRDNNEITVTMDGQIVGTPAYMSPEQAQGNSHTSDQRSDVYAVGVILFELLTGELPFRGSLPTLMQQVVSADPPRPRALQPRVPRDLETICLKCLEKRPERRYQTAERLALDLDRFLAKRPIAARPIGPLERGIRWCQRKPALAAAMALLVAVSVGGFLGVSWQAMRATRAKQDTEIEAARTQRLLDFLVSSFRSPDPNNNGRDVRVVDVLERAIDDAQEELQDDPVQVASILDAIGETLRSLGAHEPAIRAHQQALEINLAELGERHPDTLWSMNYLALNYKQSGRIKQAIPIYERTLELRRTVLGPHDEDTLLSLMNLASAYKASGDLQQSRILSEQCLAEMTRHLGEQHQLTLVVMNNLAGLYGKRGLHDEAIQLHQRTLRLRRQTLGEDHPETIVALNNLASGYADVHRHSDAIPLLEEAIEQMRQTMGPTHPWTFTATNNLATSLMQIGQVKRALTLVTESGAMAIELFGEHHEASLQLMIGRASALRWNGQVDQALAVSERALELAREHRGEDHPLTLLAMRHVGTYLAMTGQLERASGLLNNAYELTRETMGEDHPNTLGAQREWISRDNSLFERGEALEILTDNVQRERRRLADDVGTLATILSNVANTMIDGGEFQQAERLLEESLDTIEEQTPDHWKFYQAKSRLGAALAGKGNNVEAESLLLEGYQGMKDRAEHKRARPLPEDLNEACQRIVDFYLQTDRRDKAAKWQALL